MHRIRPISVLNGQIEYGYYFDYGYYIDYRCDIDYAFYIDYGCYIDYGLNSNPLIIITIGPYVPGVR